MSWDVPLCLIRFLPNPVSNKVICFPLRKVFIFVFSFVQTMHRSNLRPLQHLCWSLLLWFGCAAPNFKDQGAKRYFWWNVLNLQKLKNFTFNRPGTKPLEKIILRPSVPKGPWPKCPVLEICPQQGCAVTARGQSSNEINVRSCTQANVSDKGRPTAIKCLI